MWNVWHIIMPFYIYIYSCLATSLPSLTRWHKLSPFSSPFLCCTSIPSFQSDVPSQLQVCSASGVPVYLSEIVRALLYHSFSSSLYWYVSFKLLFADIFFSFNNANTFVSIKNFAVALSRYHPKLLSHSVCTLATSPFGCSAPFIVIVFLVTLPNDLTSSFVHSIMSAPYLETATA